MTDPQLPPGVPLSEIPSGMPPPGVQPFNTHYANRENAELGLGTSLIVVAFFFVAGRVILNTTNKARGFGWDDATSILGYIFTTGFTALKMHQRKYDRHSWDIPLSWYDSYYFKASFAGDILLCPSLFLSKITFFCLYLRIFGPSRNVRLLLYFGMFVCFATYMAAPIPLYVYYCVPSAHTGPRWDFIMGGHCLNTQILAPVQGTLNVVIDLFIIIVPIPIVAKLKMSRRRKFLLIAVFMTGSLALMASIVGLAYRILLWVHRNDSDVYYIFYTVIFIYIECFISLICAAMPAFASCSLRKLSTVPGFSSLQSFLKSTLHLESRRRTTTVKSSQVEKRSDSTPDDPDFLEDEAIPAHLTGRGYFEMNETKAQENGYAKEQDNSLPPHEQV